MPEPILKDLTISIVTPSFNQGEFIRATIDSVLSQGYPNIEFVVVDGGSTDDTVEVLKSYGDRLRWVSEADRGQSDAIVKGIDKMTSGDIVAYLNSDDVLTDGAVERVMKAFSEDPSLGLVYGRSDYIDAEGRKTGEYPVGDFAFDDLSSFNYISQPSAFFRRSCYESVGGIEVALEYTMDYDLWIKLAGRFPVRYIPEVLSGYRLHGESKTVSIKHALANNEETLETVLRHYGYVPANRVYAAEYYKVASGYPSDGGQGMIVLKTLPRALFRYLSINKGIRARDIAFLRWSNLKKLFKGWLDF